MTENRIPGGMEDLSFETARERMNIIDKLQAVYDQNGYTPVITPTMEFYSTFSKAGSPIEDGALLRQMDPSGSMTVLRPDNTAPIARLFAMRLKGLPLPIKLCYAQPVFRAGADLAGRKVEIMQSGVECIGEDGPAADAAILQTAVQCFLALGITEFKLEIGHMGIFRALTEQSGIAKGYLDDIRRSIEAKNQSALHLALEKYRGKCGETCDALALLPTLFGEAEILEKARRAFAYNAKTLEILDYLAQLLSEVTQRGVAPYVLLDLGLVQKIDYYTGMVFQGYLPGIGEAALSGGRYNELTAAYGAPGPAAGFACTVDVLAKARKSPENGSGRAARPLRVAFTKGRLEQKTVSLLEQAGYDCASLRDKGRKLIFPIPDLCEAVLAKAADVITYVEHGVCDLGVVGKDTLAEEGSCFYEVLDLGFGACRMVVAGLDRDGFYSGYRGKKIATKYPKIARDFFLAQGMDVEIIKIEGSVELAPLLHLADAIVDIVETGSTLKENGLVIFEEIFDISARLIVNTAAMKMRKQEISALIARIKGVMVC